MARLTRLTSLAALGRCIDSAEAASDTDFMTFAHNLGDGLRRGLRGLPGGALDLLLPPRCLSCGLIVERSGALCPGCWEQVAFIAPPYCAACGYPFEFEIGTDALCAACTRERPVFDRARAVMAYDQGSRRLLLSFKHGDRTDAAPAFAGWMARAAAELLPDADFLVPVPLHRIRLFRRRYNQAALLARELDRAGGPPLANDLLIRRRNTPPQGRMSRAARHDNVAGAFAVPARAKTRLAGRRVLLVDDVMTTGATVEACARILKRGGASAVDVLVLARVLRSEA